MRKKKKRERSFIALVEFAWWMEWTRRVKTSMESLLLNELSIEKKLLFVYSVEFVDYFGILFSLFPSHCCLLKLITSAYVIYYILFEFLLFRFIFWISAIFLIRFKQILNCLLEIIINYYRLILSNRIIHNLNFYLQTGTIFKP